MRSDTGKRHPPKGKIMTTDRNAPTSTNTGDDARDDTMTMGRPVTIDTESKPLFRTTSPKIEYAASSPYYDVLLYSFTPEQEQKRKQSNQPTTTITKTFGSDRDKGGMDGNNAAAKTTTTDTILNTQPMRDQLPEAGTLVLANNDHDKTGNGDQTPIYDPYLHKGYLELFRTGGDFDAHIQKSSGHHSTGRYCFSTTSTTDHPKLSIFAEHCVSGRVEKVKHILENHSVRKGKSWNVMIDLLETRETVLRLSPLLLVFCMLHKVGIVLMNQTNPPPGGNTTTAKNRNTTTTTTTTTTATTEPWLKYIDLLEQNLVKVVMELLRYGASPMAKDVCGRTVYFYGASKYATPRSLNAVTMCSNAARSAHYFGKEVILHGLETSSDTEHDKMAICNGMRGLAGGYQISKSCTGRIVFFFGRQSEVAVPHRNIRLVSSNSATSKSWLNLCNVQDRLGRVCLTELYGSKRNDVIKFLLDNHNASIDIKDWTGNTIRHQAFKTITKAKDQSSALLDDETACAQIIVTHALKCARQEQKRLDSTCTACRKVTNADHGKILQVCQRCSSVRYCSESCQADHWTNGGHKKECSRLRKLYSECIRIDGSSIMARSGKDPSLMKPSNIAVDETFTVKIELIAQSRDDDTHVLHIYDKTVECDFVLKLNDASIETKYLTLLNKVKGEFVTAGTAAYLAASFDSNGVCSIYVNRRKVRTW